MATTDLISREAAVREALRCYRGAREAVRQCREAEDDFGTLAFEGQKEAFRWMVMTLMTLPESDAVQVVRCENCLFDQRQGRGGHRHRVRPGGDGR